MNWFSAGGAEYAANRPSYPAEVAALLAAEAPGHGLAVDVGCGTGQFTALLAAHFDAVIGLDPSADQIANADGAAGIEYRVAAAEATGLPEDCADLITVAQAAHWFDLPAFYDEARRIAVDGAVIALITYGLTVVEPELAERFSHFYTDEIGPFWPPERRHVENGYADLAFPFEPLALEVPAIERDWTLDQLAGYLGTWSAARHAAESGAGDLIGKLVDDLRPAWGPPDRRRRVRWPVTVRAGRMES